MSSSASCVELEPVPAMTGTRPRASATVAADDIHVLVVVEGGRFARGADRHEAVDAALDLKAATSFAQIVVGDHACLRKRRGKGGNGARERSKFHENGKVALSRADDDGEILTSQRFLPMTTTDDVTPHTEMINDLLKLAVESGVSDVIIKSNKPGYVRISGKFEAGGHGPDLVPRGRGLGLRARAADLSRETGTTRDRSTLPTRRERHRVDSASTRFTSAGS